MKNWKVLFFVLVGIVLFGCNGNESAGVSAQSSSNEQRLFGTWIVEDSNSTWIFNADGTGSFDGTTFKYGAAEGKIIIIINSGRIGGLTTRDSYNDLQQINFYISSDGKTMIIGSPGKSFLLRNKS